MPAHYANKSKCVSLFMPLCFVMPSCDRKDFGISSLSNFLLYVRDTGIKICSELSFLFLCLHKTSGQTKHDASGGCFHVLNVLINTFFVLSLSYTYRPLGCIIIVVSSKPLVSIF